MPGEDAGILVKRYGGSRLYDTAGARYLDVSDIAALLRQGLRVEVRDASTGEEVTAEVAAQALAGR
jgi:polyhydroxyalkanoate synthesis regulator protein